MSCVAPSCEPGPNNSGTVVREERMKTAQLSGIIRVAHFSICDPYEKNEPLHMTRAPKLMEEQDNYYRVGLIVAVIALKRFQKLES